MSDGRRIVSTFVYASSHTEDADRCALGFTNDELVAIGSEFPPGKRMLVDFTEYLLPGMRENVRECSMLVIPEYLQQRNKNKEFINDLFTEHLQLNPNRKCYNSETGEIEDRIGSWYVGFAPFDQEPEVSNDMYHIVNYDRIPHTCTLKTELARHIGHGLRIYAEYFHDAPDGSGFSYRGSKFRRVMGVVLGAKVPMVFQWYFNGVVVSDALVVVLEHGDAFFLSDKASGHDYTEHNTLVLKHAGGSAEFTGVDIEYR